MGLTRRSDNYESSWETWVIVDVELETRWKLVPYCVTINVRSKQELCILHHEIYLFHKNKVEPMN
jgi:hypothetical protein